jgi:hypothetical protein
LWVDNVVSKVVLVFLASFVKTTVVVVLLALLVPQRGELSSIPAYLITQAFLSAAVAPAVFWLLASTGIQANRETE